MIKILIILIMIQELTAATSIHRGNENTIEDAISRFVKGIPPLFSKRSDMVFSPVGKKIMKISSTLGEVLQENQGQMRTIESLKSQMEQGKRTISRIEETCRYRENQIAESNERNLHLLKKLLELVQYKKGFDNQVQENLYGIYKDLKAKPTNKGKGLSAGFVLLIPDNRLKKS